MITNDAYSNDEGLTLKTVSSETPNGGQFKLSTQLIRPKLSVILRQPATQLHRFFRNLSPL